jgi:hypothetical protein
VEPIETAAATDQALRTLEAEIADTRRHVLRQQAQDGHEKVRLQELWTDLLLDRWSELSLHLPPAANTKTDDESKTIVRSSAWPQLNAVAPGVILGAPRASSPVRVRAAAIDQLTEAGLKCLLEGSPELAVLTPDEASAGGVDVCVLAADRVNAKALGIINLMADYFEVPIVLVADEIAERDLPTLVKFGVKAVLPRVSAIGIRLVDTILATASNTSVPNPDLLSALVGAN